MKSKYDDFVKPRLKQIKAWARDGVSDEDIAHNLGIAYSTFRNYKDRYKALSAALAQGKQYVDEVIVTNAYLKRITGYTAIEVKREYGFVPLSEGEIGENGKKTKKVLLKETQISRHIPGDARAAEFWLCNRQKDKWKRVPEVAESGEDTETGVAIMPSVEEIRD